MCVLSGAAQNRGFTNRFALDMSLLDPVPAKISEVEVLRLTGSYVADGARRLADREAASPPAIARLLQVLRRIPRRRMAFKLMRLEVLRDVSDIARLVSALGDNGTVRTRW